MPPEPGRVRETCAVTPNKRSCSVSRNPVFIESAITSVVTPAATPITENSVTRRRTAGRYDECRYRCATNHSNRMAGRINRLHPQKDTLRPVYFGRGVFLRFRAEQGEKNHVPDGRRIRQQHRQAVDADPFRS